MDALSLVLFIREEVDFRKKRMNIESFFFNIKKRFFKLKQE